MKLYDFFFIIWTEEEFYIRRNSSEFLEKYLHLYNKEKFHKVDLHVQAVALYLSVVFYAMKMQLGKVQWFVLYQVVLILLPQGLFELAKIHSQSPNHEWN